MCHDTDTLRSFLHSLLFFMKNIFLTPTAPRALHAILCTGSQPVHCRERRWEDGVRGVGKVRNITRDDGEIDADLVERIRRQAEEQN